MEVNGIFSALKTSVTGLSTQMKRMNVISENIANAEQAPDEDGNIYKRKVVQGGVGSTGKTGGFGDQMSLALKRSNRSHLGIGSHGKSFARQAGGEKIIVKELEDTKLVYNPGHPSADKNGYVKMPNINMVEEMVNMVSTSRNYEANVSVMTATKNMAKKAMEI